MCNNSFFFTIHITLNDISVSSQRNEIEHIKSLNFGKLYFMLLFIMKRSIWYLEFLLFKYF